MGIRNIFAAGFSALAFSACVTAAAFAAPPPIPLLSQWESQMLQYGQATCDFIADTSQDGGQRLGATYYDAARVFAQIARYTGNNGWYSCVDWANKVYRDGYVMANNGAVPGYWIFPHGMFMDFKRTGNTTDKMGMMELASTAAYANVGGYPVEWVSNADHARETAYNLMSKLVTNEIGVDYSSDLTFFVNLALSDIDQWFVSKTASFIQPFMAGLVMEALIEYHRKTGDSRVLPAVQTAADYLWANLWVANSQAFLYIDRAIDSEGGAAAIAPAPDLNLLIAPAYAWLWRQTGDAKYQVQADAIFVGGVQQAFLANGKHFNQNYRWSFDYVYWRQGVDSPLLALITPSGSTVASMPPPPSSTPPPSPSTTTSSSTTTSTPATTSTSTSTPPPSTDTSTGTTTTSTPPPTDTTTTTVSTSTGGTSTGSTTTSTTTKLKRNKRHRHG